MVDGAREAAGSAAGPSGPAATEQQRQAGGGSSSGAPAGGDAHDADAGEFSFQPQPKPKVGDTYGHSRGVGAIPPPPVEVGAVVWQDPHSACLSFFFAPGAGLTFIFLKFVQLDVLADLVATPSRQVPLTANATVVDRSGEVRRRAIARPTAPALLRTALFGKAVVCPQALPTVAILIFFGPFVSLPDCV